MTEPTPAQRVRAELVIAKEKLETLRREVDAALLTGHVERDAAISMAGRLGSIQATVWRLEREIHKLAD